MPDTTANVLIGPSSDPILVTNSPYTVTLRGEVKHNPSAFNTDTIKIYIINTPIDCTLATVSTPVAHNEPYQIPDPSETHSLSLFTFLPSQVTAFPCYIVSLMDQAGTA